VKSSSANPTNPAIRSVVSKDEWLAARRLLLAREKEFTAHRDLINAERRRLPWLKIDKDYVFDGLAGKEASARPVRRPQPAGGLPLHVRPRLERRLPQLLLCG
jgi:hypothetical protein